MQIYSDINRGVKEKRECDIFCIWIVQRWLWVQLDQGLKRCAQALPLSVLALCGYHSQVTSPSQNDCKQLYEWTCIPLHSYSIKREHLLSPGIEENTIFHLSHSPFPKSITVVKNMKFMLLASGLNPMFYPRARSKNSTPYIKCRQTKFCILVPWNQIAEPLYSIHICN